MRAPACVGLEVEDVAIHVDRALDVAEVLLAQLAEPELQLDDGAVVARRHQLELALDDRRQLVPLLRRDVDPIERAEGLQLVARSP